MTPLLQVLAVAKCASQSEISACGLPQAGAGSDQLQNILSIVFGIIGAIALLVIVVSGLRYVLSAGDPQKASKAKNGIIYALIGLVIALSAQAIVAFVVNKSS